MAFFIRDQGLEKGFGHKVADRLAMLARFDVKRADIALGGKITLQRFLEVLADAQRVKLLQVGVAFQKDDPVDEPVRVLHLFDAFGAGFGGEVIKAPNPLAASTG